MTRTPLFGAIALRRNDLVFGMNWKGRLYFKTDEEAVQEYDAAHSSKLTYTTNEGKPQALKSYAEVPPVVTEDEEKLREWAEIAYQAALKGAVRS
ncbi:TfoX/Sxy family protein [Sinorhizobium meliloti]